MALSLDGTTGISATGNIISSGGIISATGNIYGGNIIGTLVVASATFSGNVSGGNLLTGGIVSATGNITAPFFVGNGAALTGLSASKIYNGTSEANIGTSGGNANITVGGTSNVAVFATTGAYITGINSVSGNVTGGNLLTGGIVSATGNIAAPYFIGNGSALTGLSASKIFNGTSEANIGTSGGNANITIGGTSNVFVVATTGIYTTGLSSVTGNITAGNLLTGGLISATSTITSAANITGGNVLTAGLISAGGTVTGTSHLGAVVSVTGAITGAAITGSSLTVSTGNISGGNIVNNNANGVGNIGNATVYFNTVFGKATTAQYADLAELYSADAKYEPGTVLVFGGNNEVTISTVSADPRVAGVVSTNPAHLMNSVLESEHKVAVALTGRVPTSVVGTIRKGDMMVTAGNGAAQASATPAMGTVIGKALENFDGVSGTIEIVVGRL
jgi:fibronectin-binding autotransporter adhesin